MGSIVRVVFSIRHSVARIGKRGPTAGKWHMCVNIRVQGTSDGVLASFLQPHLSLYGELSSRPAARVLGLV